jgi:hypothetical protein
LAFVKSPNEEVEEFVKKEDVALLVTNPKVVICAELETVPAVGVDVTPVKPLPSPVKEPVNEPVKLAVVKVPKEEVDEFVRKGASALCVTNPKVVICAELETVPAVGVEVIPVKPLPSPVKEPEKEPLTPVAPVKSTDEPETINEPVIEWEPVKCLKLLSNSVIVSADPFTDLYVIAI